MQFEMAVPDIGSSTTAEDLKSIKNYLLMLNDQLRYMMSNIDTDNLTEDLKSSVEAGESANNTIAQLGDSVSGIAQTVDIMRFFVEKGEEGSSITMTQGGIDVLTDSLNIQGCVRFEDLAGEGTTEINGANIVTGTVEADKLSVDDISSVSARIGGWDIDSGGISSASSQGGSVSINSAESNNASWIKAKNADGDTVFALNKDGSGYVSGDFISNGTLSCSKLKNDSDLRLDLKNNGKGMLIGRDIYFVTPYGTRGIVVTDDGKMSFDTGYGTRHFSMGVEKQSDGKYKLLFYGSNGIYLGGVMLNA